VLLLQSIEFKIEEEAAKSFALAMLSMLECERKFSQFIFWVNIFTKSVYEEFCKNYN
jgi:hypothetical protein